MIYLVDGHNLIPKIPSLSLRAVDDEMQLVDLLQIFARVKRKKVEVYFDQAAVGQAGTRKFGTITAHFVNSSSSADQAIRQRLENSDRGKGVRPDTCVVSSDHAVQNSARIYHAQVQTSEAFERELREAVKHAFQPGQTWEKKISEAEVDEWLRIFGQSPSREDHK